MWRLIDLDATAYGFVLTLRDGRRRYLGYQDYVEDDEPVRHVTMHPMDDERYPESEREMAEAWEEDVAGLNRHFGN
jgi:hypothetical protein